MQGPLLKEARVTEGRRAKPVLTWVPWALALVAVITTVVVGATILWLGSVCCMGAVITWSTTML